MPIVLFLLLNVMTPDFYSSVWHVDLTKFGLGAAGGWMLVGNFIMYRMVQLQDLTMDAIFDLLPIDGRTRRS